jgi:glycosyltransferase involved in cell wall biosynthesis
VKVAYITPGGSVHDEQWLKKLRQYFEVVTRPDLGVDIVQSGPIAYHSTFGENVALMNKCPFVMMSWGFDVLETKPGFSPSLYEDALRCIVKAADAFICDSNVVRDKLLELRQGDPPPIIQLPWGVDLEMFSPSNESPKHQLVARNRGIDTVVDAFGRTRLYAWGFVMPRKTPHDAMPGVYRQAWAYICASPSDGSSVSLLEAMASGLPVIVSDIAGNREWVTHGVNGWLCKHDDPQAFADAIVECASMSVVERKQMGERNRAVVEARADWNRNFEKLVEAYHAIVGK